MEGSIAISNNQAKNVEILFVKYWYPVLEKAPPYVVIHKKGCTGLKEKNLLGCHMPQVLVYLETCF